MAKKLLRIFISTTIILLLIITTLLLAYIYFFPQEKASETAVNNRQENSRTLIKTNPLDKKITSPKEEDRPSFAVFIMDAEEKNIISSAYITFLDRKNNKLSLYSLSGDTVFELSASLYTELTVSLIRLPQIVRLSHFYKYSPNETGLKASVIMLNDCMRTDIRHYIMLDKETADKVFKAADEKGFTEDFKRILITGKGVKKFVKENYKSRFTDISKKDMKWLLNECKGISEENISFKELPASKNNMGSILDGDAALSMMYGSDEQ